MSNLLKPSPKSAVKSEDRNKKPLVKASKVSPKATGAKKPTTSSKDSKVKEEVKNDGLFVDYTYPKNNYDFNYSGLVKNNYDPKKLGINNGPTLCQFKHNIKLGTKFMDGLINEPTPGPNDIAGITDLDKSDSEAVKKSKDNFLKTPPYKKFRQEYPESRYPTNGIYSNSYFIQSGFCPVVIAKTENECISFDPKYVWMSNGISIPKLSMPFFKKEAERVKDPQTEGKCYKPRYSYINHGSDSGMLDGLMPSVLGDVVDLNPANFMNLLKEGYIEGNDYGGPPRFELLKCIEGFQNSYVREYMSKNIVICIIFLLIILVLYLYL